MCLNAFFAFTLIIDGGIPWPVALGIIFWATLIPLTFSITQGILLGAHSPRHAACRGGPRSGRNRGSVGLAAVSVVLLVIEHVH